MNDESNLSSLFLFGSIYDEVEEKALMAVLKQECRQWDHRLLCSRKNFTGIYCETCILRLRICTTDACSNAGNGNQSWWWSDCYSITSFDITCHPEGGANRSMLIDPRTFISIKGDWKKIPKKTKAYMFVTYGDRMCDMDRLWRLPEHKRLVLEDCAHAMAQNSKGKQRPCSIGDVCVSFPFA